MHPVKNSLSWSSCFEAQYITGRRDSEFVLIAEILPVLPLFRKGIATYLFIYTDLHINFSALISFIMLL